MTNFNVPTDTIGIAGDWHGNTFWAKESLEAFKDFGITEIFHLGDFGIWGGQDGSVYIRKIAKWLSENGQTLYVTLGNHEDYVRVNSTPVAADGTQWYQGHESIKLLPRGFRGTVGASVSRSWVSLGGANSIDFKGRTEGLSWWREESITVGDVYRTAEGGHAELMFCHDAPIGVPFPFERKGEEAGWQADEIHYSNQGREMLKQAVDAVQPTVLFHGHHHCFQDLQNDMKVYGSDEVYTLRTVGLACDEMSNNLIAYDVTNDTFEVVK
jgi:hypothetical protein